MTTNPATCPGPRAPRQGDRVQFSLRDQPDSPPRDGRVMKVGRDDWPEPQVYVVSAHGGVWINLTAFDANRHDEVLVAHVVD